MAFATRLGEGPSARRRAVSLGLAVVAHILIALLLLHLTPHTEPPRATVTESFALLPDRGERTETSRRTERSTTRPRAAKATPRPADRPVPVPPTTPPPPDDPMLRLFGRKDLFAGGDIGRLRGEPRDGGGAGAGDSVAAYGPGEGPGGRRLYPAEWYREPTDSQLSPYIRVGAPRPGWGVIACRTIDDYRVDDCRQLGESPLGSGYAAAVKQAAWQFRVRPPRINGRPQVGEWVRIRIDYTEREAAPG